MSQEESFRFGCHRSSKKHKHNRVPQRGLGVAQLEKIRLEEQQKSFPNCHSFPAINHHQTPPHSTSVSYKSSQDPVFTIPDLLQPLSSSETPANPPLLPRFWSHPDTFFPKVENCGLPLPALYDSNASTEQNTSVTVSPTSSSGVNLPMEPPSNQIYTKNEFTPAAQGRLIGIKRPWSFLNNNPRNFSLEKRNRPEYGNSTLRATSLHPSSDQTKWKPLADTDLVRSKDNCGPGDFLTLGLTSFSPSIASPLKSSLFDSMCDDGDRCQIQIPKESNGGSTGRDSVPNSRSGGEKTVSGSDEHLQPQQVRHHFYPHLLHQAGGQFYRFLHPEPSSRKSEVEDRRDSVHTERKARIDLNLKL